MRHGIIYDCEFLAVEGSPSRYWCGPYDPDPVVVQIGLVKLGLEADFPILETSRIYVIPKGRQGNTMMLDPFFTGLTGITQQHLDSEGISLVQALEKVIEFSAGSKLWSWGKDEINMVAISCYVEGVPPMIAADKFGNACDILLRAGMPYEDIRKTPSNRLSAYFQLDSSMLRGHDALDDALSVSYAIQHLLGEGALQAQDFD